MLAAIAPHNIFFDNKPTSAVYRQKALGDCVGFRILSFRANILLLDNDFNQLGNSSLLLLCTKLLLARAGAECAPRAQVQWLGPFMHFS